MIVIGIIYNHGPLAQATDVRGIMVARLRAQLWLRTRTGAVAISCYDLAIQQ